MFSRRTKPDVYHELTRALIENPASSGQGILSADRKKPRKTRLPKGIWSEVDGLLDPAVQRPRLADHIELKEFKLRWGNDYAIIANKRDLIFYRLDPGEVEVVRLMDGTRTISDIVVARFEQTGEFELSGIADLARQLEFGNMLANNFIDVSLGVKTALDPPRGFNYRLRMFLKSLRIEWKEAERLVVWLYRHGFKIFFTKWAQPPMAIIAVIGIIAFVGLVRSRRFGLFETSAAWDGLILILLNHILIFLHELGHAMVLVHHGRRVKSAGFLIYFGSPAFFVDSTDGLLLERKERIIQAFAGPYAELVIAGAVSIFAALMPDLAVSQLLYRFALLNYFVIFINLVPLLELDGYWIFSDLIQVPDLRRMSLNFVRYDLWHKLAKRLRMSKQEVALGAYGILGIAFTFFSLYSGFFFWWRLFGGFVTKMWEAGMVTRALLIFLILFLGGPVIRGLIGFLRSVGRQIAGAVANTRFKIETKWRVEAAELLDALPLFHDIPVDVLEDLAGRVTLKRYSTGQPVVRQGDLADAFYVVRDGTLAVIEEDRTTGTERKLRTLGRGESFGELGLIDAAPRAVTVRALEKVEVFEVDKGTFDRLLADMIQVERFAPTVQAIAGLKRLKCFTHLEPHELLELLDLGEWVTMAPGETVMRQSEPGDAFYAIETGKAEVIRNRKVIHTLGPGGYFGEVALLLDVPRTATVRTITPMRAFRVDKDAFQKLMKKAFTRGTLNPQTPMNRTWKH